MPFNLEMTYCSSNMSRHLLHSMMIFLFLWLLGNLDDPSWCKFEIKYKLMFLRQEMVEHFGKRYKMKQCNLRKQFHIFPHFWFSPCFVDHWNHFNHYHILHNKHCKYWSLLLHCRCGGFGLIGCAVWPWIGHIRCSGQGFTCQEVIVCAPYVNKWQNSYFVTLYCEFWVQNSCPIFTFRPSVRPQASHPILSQLYDLLDHTNQVFCESLWHALSIHPPPLSRYPNTKT